MANSRTQQRSGSQFFIVAGPQASMPTCASTYSLFGHVASGQDVVNTINQQGSQRRGARPT